LISGLDNEIQASTADERGQTYFHRRVVERQGAEMEIKTISVEMPENANVIIGQSHFIKTAEDLYEAIVGSVPQAKFGVAFCEASGPCLVRVEGNDDALKSVAARTAMSIGAGHTFVAYLRDSYPINVLNAVKGVQEVCTVFCATANPLEVVVAENERGRGVLGVIDGEGPKGIETPKDAEDRRSFLRMIGYKR
jgi:adenosine/AMP kinase